MDLRDFLAGSANTSPFLGIVIMAAFIFGITLSFVGSIPMSEDGFRIWILSLGGFVGGVGLFGWGFTEYRRRSVIANTPTSNIRSLAMGAVELTGEARPDGRPLRSPFTGEDCVFYRYTVEEWDDSGKHSHWDSIDTGRSHAPFRLDDGTGQVLVDPSGADYRIPADSVITVHSFDELPAPAQEFVRELEDVDTQQDEIFEEKRRYTEHYLRPGETVYVFGKAFPRRDHAGTIDNPENAVINADVDTPMFVISDRSEKELLSRMRWRSLGSIGGGFLLAVGGFAILVGIVGLL